MKLPQCPGCGRPDTPDDCVCCDNCNQHPCKCFCEKCGERIGGNKGLSDAVVQLQNAEIDGLRTYKAELEAQNDRLNERIQRETTKVEDLEARLVEEEALNRAEITRLTPQTEK